eukprot:TRINITY_DN461_c0_g1_i1.p1 TRINITY_DN461_c0_g1~~TRINITY_DN461_c0_g1_i1.p1  ORF type:complete len:145 (+),score=14.69 TRINITY_DN461_c0_g1_i1:42-476(+)
MSSWAVSACYPRRTFYPLSDGPSTQNHRITMTDFRLCSTCQSHSQAGLCHCTQRSISNRPEPTIARLRYYLGGARPSQTTRHRGSQSRFHGTWLDIRNNKGGISRAVSYTHLRAHETVLDLVCRLLLEKKKKKKKNKKDIQRGT